MLTRTVRRPSTAWVTGLLAAALGIAGALAPAAPAQAASRITATNDRGSALADDDRSTTFTLRGSGFQSVKGGFGGVYVAFGWVRDPSGGGWRPSRGGVTGRDYRYVPDSESEDNAGYLRFVAFPGSSTAGEAQAVMSSDGAFSVEVTVPGPTFQAVDRNGAAVDVDCRTVTCGFLTFGAHGVKNAANETFTPVRFGDVYADDSGPAGSSTAPDGSTSPSVGGSSPTPGGGGASTGAPTGSSGSTSGTATVRRGRPQVVTERATARAGQALAFTGRGFAPGEQVLALLDDGLVALGPLVAGAAGDVAGVMALPTGLATGTHELRLVGAASGARPTERFPVRAATTAAGDIPDAGAVAEGGERDVAALVFVTLAGLALLASLALLVVRLRRRFRRPAAATATTGAVA